VNLLSKKYNFINLLFSKLDMTLNFIDIEDLSASMKNLVKCPKIKELYLTGNPCESWEGFKEYVIASIPQLTSLNGQEILKSERIKAFQKFPFLEKELEKASIENIIKKENDPDRDNPNRYTKEYRRKMYKEMEEEKLQKEEEKKKNSKPWGHVDDFYKGPLSVYKDNGEIRVCNQGKYDFLLDEDIYYSGIMTFELKLPKYLDTVDIEVDLNPQYIRVNVKGKVTQIRFDHEVIVEQSSIQRSTTTGYLLIKAPIVGIVPKEKPKNINNKQEKKNIDKNNQSKTKILKPIDESLRLNNIKKGINHIEMVEKTETKFPNKKVESQKIEIDEDINLDEIPDLD
jgi:protein TilB